CARSRGYDYDEGAGAYW
nr:immunoglobulin heavy chain junction region [Mus musculus]